MLILPETPREQLESLVREGYPYEVCGVMVGRVAADGALVERIVQARNLNTTRAEDRFELAPDDFLAADQAARASGLEIVGIWHSHPDHPARPSQTDLDAAWEGWSYIIVSVSGQGIEDLRSWRIAQGEHRFVEESIAASAEESRES